MIPILEMLLKTRAGSLLQTFIEDCGFTAESVTSLKYYAETTRDREAETGPDYRCFKPTGNCMYVLTFENGAQHCKFVNAEMLAETQQVTA
jgi:hypothetical protein